jgi:hypothetical protein
MEIAQQTDEQSPMSAGDLSFLHLVNLVQGCGIDSDPVREFMKRLKDSDVITRAERLLELKRQHDAFNELLEIFRRPFRGMAGVVER